MTDKLLDNNRLQVVLLGATGMVGQQLVRLLDGHPRLRITGLASGVSAGKPYAQATVWRLSGRPHGGLGSLPVRPCEPGAFPGPPGIAFSALPGAGRPPGPDPEAAARRGGGGRGHGVHVPGRVRGGIRRGGMAVTVGRVERCRVLGLKYYVLGHNTVRGAAGAALLNAELLMSEPGSRLRAGEMQTS